MIDIRLLRDQPDLVRASQRSRGEDEGLVDAILAADEARRASLTDFEAARAEQKAIGKDVARAQGDEKQAILARVKDLYEESDVYPNYEGRIGASPREMQVVLLNAASSTRYGYVSPVVVLEEMADRRGGNLSGGQQQQLAIARALATRPRLLLLDEPTEGIQPSIILELARVLRRIRDQRGLGILVSEQVLHFALDVADRVIVLENGRITMQSTRDEVDERAVAARLAV